MKKINNTIITKGIVVLFGFLTIVLALLVVPQFTVASADCDKDATCRDRNGNDPGDKRFCRNPGSNNSECQACLNGDSSQCQSGYTCQNGVCIAPTPTNTPAPVPATPTPVGGTVPSGTVFLEKQVTCGTPSNQRTPNQICQANGYDKAGAVISATGVPNAALGFWWKQCGGAKVNFGTGFQYTINTTDCTNKADEWGLQNSPPFAVYPNNYIKVATADVAFDPLDPAANTLGLTCTSHNPGWTVRVACVNEPTVTAPPTTVTSVPPGTVVVTTDANGVAIISFKKSETSVAAFTSALNAKFAGEGVYTAAACVIPANYTPPAPEVTLSANPTTINSGGTSTLTWTTKNVTTCTAEDGWTGTKSPTGGTESTGALTTSKDYSLSCTGPGGTVTATTSVTVNSTPKTSLNFSLLLHGMGAAGDNVVPQPAPCKRTNGTTANPAGCLSNQEPQRPTRSITVEVLNQNNTVEATKSGEITYDNATGTFKGSVDLGEDWQTGVYNIKVLSTQYLRRQIAGFHTITSGQAYNVPVSNLVSSDVDKDNRLTILDYNMIITCYTFIGDPAKCAPGDAVEVDVNDDAKNDEFDENLFRRDLIVQYGQ